MEWHSFVIGLVSAALAFAMFSESGEETEADEEVVSDSEHTGLTDVDIHDFSSRHVTLSCQTCRKLKRHKEVQPNLFQCVKCKRHVDIRVS